ncbi:MAG: tetratricopeptide repeat protein [Nitrospinales bacterium]
MKNLFAIIAITFLISACSSSPQEIKKAELDKSIKDNPQNAQAHYEMGKMKFDDGHYPQAISHFEQAIQLNPTNMDSYAHLAAAYNLNGKYDEVIKLLQRPELSNHPENRFALGMAYMGRSNLVGARERLIKAMDDKPELERVYYKALGEEPPADAPLSPMELAMARVLDRLMDDMRKQIRIDIQEDIRESALRDK